MGNFRRKIIPYDPILKQRARRLRKNMTRGEIALWNELKQNKLGFDFDRQRPIDHYIVDFYCKDLMLAIEIDGGCHFTEEAQIKDIHRQQRLEALGVRFLRFDHLKVRNETNEVISTIKNWIDEHKDHLVGRIPTSRLSQEVSVDDGRGM